MAWQWQLPMIGSADLFVKNLCKTSKFDMMKVMDTRGIM